MPAVCTVRILGPAAAVGGTIFLPAAATALPAGASPAGGESVPGFRHVLLTIGENTGLNHVNKTDMPF